MPLFVKVPRNLHKQVMYIEEIDTLNLRIIK